jgi:replicative DNA helicase
LLDSVNNGRVTSGLKSGFDNLDAILHGFKPGELTCIAGRPGTGKTAIALNLTLNIAKYLKARNDKKAEGEKKEAIIFFSIEMRNFELFNRMVMCESGEKISTFSKNN